MCFCAAQDSVGREHCAVPDVHSEELLLLIRYPGPTGSPENHKRGYSLDGVRSKRPATSRGYLLP